MYVMLPVSIIIHAHEYCKLSHKKGGKYEKNIIKTPPKKKLYKVQYCLQVD